jgi:hypothetical protein
VAAIVSVGDPARIPTVTVCSPTEHPSPARAENCRIYRQNSLDALLAIDSPKAALMPQQPPPRKPLKRAYRSVLSRLR